MLNFEWSPAKNDAYVAKHGIDFQDAIAIFASFNLVSRSDKNDEARLKATGILRGREIAVVYTIRGGIYRSFPQGGRGRMSAKRITRRTLTEAGGGRTDWTRIDAMTEEEIEANALSDPDNLPWTDEELRNAELLMPPEGGKEAVSLRLDREVLNYFRGSSEKYQSRINAVLLAYVRSQRSP